MPSTKKIPQPDYDTRWKEAIENMHSYFIAYFFSKLAPLIDWSKGVRFLDKELQQLLPDWQTKGKRNCDMLLEYHLLSGEKQLVLVHIEVQRKFDSTFTWRMYTTFSRIIQKYPKKKFTAIAIYTGGRIAKQYDSWEYHYYGVEMRYKFPTYIVRDQKEEELLQQDNPFSLMILTCLYILQGKKQYKNDYEWLKDHKIRLVRLCFQHGYEKQVIKNLLIFVSYMVPLPKEEDKEFSKFKLISEVRSTDYIYRLNVCNFSQRYVVPTTFIKKIVHKCGRYYVPLDFVIFDVSYKCSRYYVPKTK